MVEANKRKKILSSSEQTRKSYASHLPINTFRQHGPPSGDNPHVTKSNVDSPTPLISSIDYCEAHNPNDNTAGSQSTNEISAKVPIPENLAKLGSPPFEEPIIVYGSANHAKVEWLAVNDNFDKANGGENDFDSPVAPSEEAPQLQAWVYETSNGELTFGERLQKGYWEK